MANISLWDFTSNADDSVISDGTAQNGSLINGASVSGGSLNLNGSNQYMEVAPDAGFQLSQGTIELNFTQSSNSGTQTLFSRDNTGYQQGGHLTISVQSDGSVDIRHQTTSSSHYYSTPNGFFSTGDEVQVTYSWDSTGVNGALNVTNVTTGATYSQAISDSLTLDMQGNNEPIIIGASQAYDGGVGTADYLQEYFNGSIDYVSISDTIDAPGSGLLDYIVEGTSGNDVIDASYTDDPDGDMIDANDHSDGSNDDEVDAGAGNDTVESGSGNDTVTGGMGDDSILGGDGDDTLRGDTASVDGESQGDASSLVMSYANIRPGSATGDATDAQVGDSIIYDNAATLPDGTVVAIKVTLTELTTPDASVSFAYNASNGPILIDGGGLASSAGETATFNVEFIDQTTGEPIVMSGQATVMDIDDNSGAGAETVTFSSETFTAWGVDGATSLTVANTANGATATGTENNGASDQDGWFTGYFEAQDSLTVTLGVVEHGAAYGFNGQVLSNPVITETQHGNDTLDGGAGNDLVMGDGGNDDLSGGSGADTLDGGTGDDVINAADDAASSGSGSSSPTATQVGLWEFDNADPLDDQAAIDNDAQLVGDATPDGNGGISLDGSGDYIKIPHHTDYDLTHATVQVDFTVDNLSSNQGIVSRDSNGFDGGGHFTLRVLTDGSLQFRWQDTSQSYYINSAAGTITAGQEASVQIAFDNDTNEIEMFVDGVSVGTVTAPVTLAGNTEPWTLGASQIYSGDSTDSGADDFMDGTISHFEIWDEALTPDQLSAGGDSVLGGTGNDTIFANAGDTVDGGEDGDGLDVDVLNLSGSDAAGGYHTITYSTNPESGIVEYFDSSNNSLGTMEFHNIEKVICFTPGTMIATPMGEVPIEALSEGDRVITRDNGVQKIAWIGQKSLDRETLLQQPHLRPVRIKAGALGNGLPERDMMVSPQHRMLVMNEETSLYFEEREVLVAAKHMLSANGIERADVPETTYIHMMFEHHEIVLANGAWTESFQPGDYSLDGLGNAQRKEIFELFPELQDEAGLNAYHSARLSLKGREASVLFRG